MTTTLHRPNAYPATCVRCGARIPAGQGLLARTDDGRWAADHPADCPEKPIVTAHQPTAAAREKVNHDGMYQTSDGTIYKVQIAKNGSGNLYAKRLILDTDQRGTSARFEYAPGAIHNLYADQRMTTEQAAAFGALYGICCNCGRDLTDEDSIARGIGPICAKNFG